MFRFKELNYTKQFDDSYQGLQTRVQKQCDKAIDFLLTNPDHPGLNFHPIKPSKIYWEAYINAGDRLIVRPEGSVLHVMDVVTHDEIAKWR